MKLDEDLRATIPDTLPPLDHAALQRRGRRRRLGTRMSAVAGVVAIAGLGVAVYTSVSPPTTSIPPAGSPDDTTPLAEDPEVAAEDAGPSPLDETDPSTDGPTQDAQTDWIVIQEDDGEPDPDADVVDHFAGLSHEQVVNRLVDVLAESEDAEQRPEGLVSITIAKEHGALDRFVKTRGDETAADYAVVTVLDPDFDPDRGYETEAFQPTWTYDAARNALDALLVSDQFEYHGVSVDPLGRTVLVFAAKGSGQEVHVDPASGYTTGVLIEVSSDDGPTSP